MRFRVVISALVVGALVLSAAVVFRSRSSPHTPATTPNISAAEEVMKDSSQAAKAPEKPANETTRTATAAASESSASAEASPDSTAARQNAYVQARISELQDLAMENDAASLNIICSELTNRDPEIRKAALEAAVQFGSRDAIPKLLEAVSQTDDSKEKAAIEEAVEFLKLPSLTEVLQERAGSKLVQGKVAPK